MQSDPSAYGGVRYALQPTESRQVKQVAQEHGGLTRDEIRALARRFGVATKPIHHALEELKLPVLAKRNAPPRGGILTLLKTSVEAKKEEKPSAPDHEVENLRLENARLRKELEEARRIRAVADTDIAKAKKSLADTAELRKRTASEREELENVRQQNDDLLEALRRCRMVLEELAQRYETIVPRLRKSQLEDLARVTEDELRRRAEGGRRTPMP